ncbi:hypothetical protein Q4485_03625 [Granulosicoccaceae sp. 1_MG-2023]|nr:hypothetical protein [Granulosicoccaceae sp. 1_MG-2023]
MHTENEPGSLSFVPAGACVCDAGLALIRVQGADATAFLHGQFSNDLKALAPGQSQISSYSTAKGRVLAVFDIARTDDAYLIALPADILESFIKRLSMFVMRADVKLSPLEGVPAGLVGADAAAALARAGLPAPEADSLEAGVWRLSGQAPAFLLCDAQSQAALAQAGVAEAGTSAWTLSRIAAGVAAVTAATQDAFVAQQLNLDRIGGINFKKGCYPGQEVIARMHYLGKPSRRMLAYALDGAAPAVGSELLNGAGDAVGTVVSAAADGQGGAVLLAVMKLKSLAADVSLSTADGVVLRPLSLPYTLEDPDEA